MLEDCESDGSEYPAESAQSTPQCTDDDDGSAPIYLQAAAVPTAVAACFAGEAASMPGHASSSPADCGDLRPWQPATARPELCGSAVTSHVGWIGSPAARGSSFRWKIAAAAAAAAAAARLNAGEAVDLSLTAPGWLRLRGCAGELEAFGRSQSF